MNIKDSIFSPSTNTQKQTSPLFTSNVAAGFPSTADNFSEEGLDLNKLLINHRSATYFVKVQGRSMEDANIFEGDILIVDKSITPTNKAIIIASINGEFTVKRLIKSNEKLYLEPANKSFSKIEISPLSNFELWGVVTYIIHRAK